MYSVEDRLQKVRTLIQKHHADGYVFKGRKGPAELEEAIHTVYNNKIYLSDQVKEALSSKTDLEIDDYDIHLIQLLSKGFSQDDISLHLKNNKIFYQKLLVILILTQYILIIKFLKIPQTATINCYLSVI